MRLTEERVTQIKAEAREFEDTSSGAVLALCEDWLEMAKVVELLRKRIRLRGENYSDSYERHAAVFYKETGYLAPGKSEPLVASSGDRERYEAWDKWIADRDEALWGALDALDRPGGGE